MSLRDQILRGGTYLALRQGIGMLIGLIGVVLLTRSIGPGAYGIYAGALGVYTFLYILSKWGTEVYLIRYEGEIQAQDYHQAFSLLLILGLAGAAMASLAAPLLGHWMNLEGFGPVAAVMFAGLPVNLLSVVPLAQLERELDYRKVAWVELSVQVTFYLVALPLAYSGAGSWAPVGGWWAQQLIALGLLYLLTSYRPRLHWETPRVRAMVGYGLGYSASTWAWQLRLLVNPLVVGRYAGAEVVGYVALAIRLVEVLSFAKSVGYRLSISALARFQQDRDRLASALTEGMQLQVLSLGFPLLAFGLLGPWIVPLSFGHRWLPILEVYPFIALGYLANSIFSLHSSALYVLRRNWEVTVFHLVHITLFAGTAFLLVPRLGAIGYGWAEVLALAGYAVIHFYVVRAIGSPGYRLAVAWGTAFILAFFWRELGLVTGLGFVGVALWPQTWKTIGRYVRDLRRAFSG